ncbi:MAG TPA: lysophospholipase [Bacteroidales bacterium]|nr:lysophospholipase [Bacteroidales bacterium]
MLQSNLRKEYNLNHVKFQWQARDGKELFAQKWDAGKNSRAAILLVHGLGEHSSRYAKWASKLVEEGISVLSFDFRGHGQTPGKPGQISDYHKLLNDVDLLIEKGKDEFKNQQLFLYGHSMGGNLVANYAIMHTTDLCGIILTSPWFELTNIPPVLKLNSALFLSKIMPWVVARSGIKPEHMSRELREVHMYKSDPLIHDKLSLGLFRKAFEQGKVAKRSIYKINAPLLVMHGTSDQVTSYKASREFISNASDKTTFVEWDGGYHELHNDIESDKVFLKLMQLLNELIVKCNA